jgi:hypothetical protein
MLTAPAFAGLPHNAQSFFRDADFFDLGFGKNFSEGGGRAIEMLLCCNSVSAHQGFSGKSCWQIQPPRIGCRERIEFCSRRTHQNRKLGIVGPGFDAAYRQPELRQAADRHRIRNAFSVNAKDAMAAIEARKAVAAVIDGASLEQPGALAEQASP